MEQEAVLHREISQLKDQQRLQRRLQHRVGDVPLALVTPTGLALLPAPETAVNHRKVTEQSARHPCINDKLHQDLFMAAAAHMMLQVTQQVAKVSTTRACDVGKILM